MHTNIVALGVMWSDWGSTAPPNFDGGSEEDSGDEGIGSGTAEYKRNAPGFAAKVEHLLRLVGHIKYPVNVVAALSEVGERGNMEVGEEISSLEDVCPKCDGKYCHLKKSVRVTDLVPVSQVARAILLVSFFCNELVRTPWPFLDRDKTLFRRLDSKYPDPPLLCVVA